MEGSYACKIGNTLQTHRVYSTLKRRKNVLNVENTWCICGIADINVLAPM